MTEVSGVLALLLPHSMPWKRAVSLLDVGISRSWWWCKTLLEVSGFQQAGSL
jgi:hypothetical protein